MKKAFTSRRLNLPAIGAQSQLQCAAEASEAEQVSCLDQWACQNEQPPPRRARGIAALYRESFGRRMRQRELTESSLLVEARLFLLRLESELQKAQDINYEAIYKNIEFCSGVFENAYGGLLREAARLREAVAGRREELEECLRGERLHHIQSMEHLEDKENYRSQIPAVRKAIEDREAELEPLRALLDDLQDARTAILRRCLAHGFDVREEGLVWVLRELAGEVGREDFPKFLNEREVDYLLTRFRSEQAAAERAGQLNLLAVAPQKSEGEIIDILTRKKKREFTMAHDAALLAELQQKQAQRLNSERHQLISSEVLRMAKEELAATKATSYELVYKETVRKLHKFCSDQIHNKGRCSNPCEPRRDSSATLKLISCFDAKVDHYLRETARGPHPRPHQEAALDEILRSLRYEGYQLGERAGRNAVSVVACLVGWKKARKLIDNEFNSLL